MDHIDVDSRCFLLVLYAITVFSCGLDMLRSISREVLRFLSIVISYDTDLN